MGGTTPTGLETGLEERAPQTRVSENQAIKVVTKMKFENKVKIETNFKTDKLTKSRGKRRGAKFW